MLQDFFDKFQAASFTVTKFDLAASPNSLILQEIFPAWELKVAHVLCNCQSQVKSNGTEKESAANSILCTLPKNEEVLNVVDMI